jgi:Flp pilus assembly protein TadG
MQSRRLSNRDSQFRPCRPRTAAPRRRRGVAALEFAIVLPILITILLGATDFGRFSHSSIAIANAARCGAAFATTNPYDSRDSTAWTAGVTKAVTNELSESTAFDPAKLTVTVAPVAESSGLLRFSVQVAYPFETLVNWPLLPASFDLKQSVVMRSIR